MTKSIAVVGAARDPNKFGYRAVAEYLAQGWQVFPINPHGGEIAGVPALKSLADVPLRPLDRISFYVPPAVGLTLLETVREIGCRELWLNPGSADDALRARAEELGLPLVEACSLLALHHGKEP